MTTKKSRCILALLITLGLQPAACGGCRKPREGVKVGIPPARAAYVTDNGSDTISVLDRDGERVVAVPVDLDPGRHEAPHHLAVRTATGGDTARVFVALAFPPDPGKPKDRHGGHGAGEDRGKLAALALPDLAIERAVDVDENPGEVVLTHDGTRVLVTHFDMRRAMNVAARGGGSPATMFARLLVFDARTLALTGERPLCVAPHGMATTPDDRTLVVACHGSDELAVVDLSQPSLPASRHALGIAQGVPGVPHYGPYSVAMSPAGDRVLVANLESSDLMVFDLAARAFVPGADVALGARAYMPAFAADGAALVPLQAPDGLARVDLAARRVAMRVSYTPGECGKPHAARVARDGRAYVVCEGDHEGPGAVLEIDPVTLATKRRWRVGVYPDGIAFGDGS